MVVGILLIDANIESSASLKDKRRIIKSVLAKVQNRFNVSASEVEFQDEWQRTSLGFSCTSNSAAHADSMMSSIIRFIEANPEIEVYNISTEVIHV